jgi:hypothetical protein
MKVQLINIIYFRIIWYIFITTTPIPETKSTCCHILPIGNSTLGRANLNSQGHKDVDKDSSEKQHVWRNF